MLIYPYAMTLQLFEGRFGIFTPPEEGEDARAATAHEGGCRAMSQQGFLERPQLRVRREDHRFEAVMEP